MGSASSGSCAWRSTAPNRVPAGGGHQGGGREDPPRELDMSHSSALREDAPANRVLRVLVATLMALIPLLSVSVLGAAPASATTAVSGSIDPANGFPSWYEDEAGNRVVPCLDPADPNCVLAGFTPGPGPITFPTNFPGEFFYTIADSNRITTNGCKGTKRGTVEHQVRAGGNLRHGQRGPGGRAADRVRPNPDPGDQRAVPQHHLPVRAPVRDHDAHNRLGWRHPGQRGHGRRGLCRGPVRVRPRPWSAPSSAQPLQPARASCAGTRPWPPRRPRATWVTVLRHML